MPAVSPHLEYTFGSKLDLDVKVVREAKTIFLPFVESEDEFAASGIRAIFQNGNHFLFWERNYSNIRDYFNSMISLYRAEYNINGRASITTAKAIVDDFQDIHKLLLAQCGERKTRRSAST